MTMMAGCGMDNLFGDIDADDTTPLFMVLIAKGMALALRFKPMPGKVGE